MMNRFQQAFQRHSSSSVLAAHLSTGADASECSSPLRTVSMAHLHAQCQLHGPWSPEEGGGSTTSSCRKDLQTKLQWDMEQEWLLPPTPAQPSSFPVETNSTDPAAAVSGQPPHPPPVPPASAPPLLHASRATPLGVPSSGSACAACHRLKYRCEDVRPCSRCVRGQRDCVDRSVNEIQCAQQRKKRKSVLCPPSHAQQTVALSSTAASFTTRAPSASVPPLLSVSLGMPSPVTSMAMSPHSSAAAFSRLYLRALQMAHIRQAFLRLEEQCELLEQRLGAAAAPVLERVQMHIHLLLLFFCDGMTHQDMQSWLLQEQELPIPAAADSSSLGEASTLTDGPQWANHLRLPSGRLSCLAYWVHPSTRPMHSFWQVACAAPDPSSSSTSPSEPGVEVVTTPPQLPTLSFFMISNILPLLLTQLAPFKNATALREHTCSSAQARAQSAPLSSHARTCPVHPACSSTGASALGVSLTSSLLLTKYSCMCTCTCASSLPVLMCVGATPSFTHLLGYTSSEVAAGLQSEGWLWLRHLYPMSQWKHVNTVEVAQLADLLHSTTAMLALDTNTACVRPASAASTAAAAAAEEECVFSFPVLLQARDGRSIACYQTRRSPHDVPVRTHPQATPEPLTFATMWTPIA